MKLKFAIIPLMTIVVVTAAFVFIRPEAERRPNIILIMADDMGYECLGTYGSASYQTPNLDKLAENGVRFEHCYAQPLCTPSRVEIMTGKHNFRNYTDFGYLDPREKTFANLLKDAGYSTCIAGKWQLNGISGQKKPGWNDVTRPNQFGFDEYCLWQLHNGRSEGERYANPLIIQNGRPLPRDNDAYGPDIFSRFILDFIDRKKDQPFFIYYPMALVHDPFVPTPHSKDWPDRSLRYRTDTSYFRDMMSYADRIVGGIVDKLEQSGLAENTLVIFTGDNGTNRNITSKMRDGRVILGGKGTMTDAGTRVPLIACWKGKSPAGKVNSDLVDFTDFLPTLAEAAQMPVPKDFIADGQSFLPQILGKRGKPKDYIYMYYDPRWGNFENGVFVRNKKYKLYSDGRFYNVQEDVREQHPINVTTANLEDRAAGEALKKALDRMQALRP